MISRRRRFNELVGRPDDATVADGASDTAVAVAAHVAESDPHTQYLTEAAAATLYQPLNAANLSAIAALTSTTYGRALLELANQAALRTAVGERVVPLFDHFTDSGNVGTDETDLYSDLIPAGRLANNGEKLEAQFAGVFVSSGTATRQIRIRFSASGSEQLFFDTGALTLSLSSAWDVYVEIIRMSASVVRCSTSLTTQGAALAAYTAYTEITGLTLANAQRLKITGEADGIGAASNDIVAKLGHVAWRAAA